MENTERENVLAAYFSLTLKGEQVNGRNLTEETLKLSRLTDPNSIAMKAQRAVKIRGTVVSLALEQSSQRYVLTYSARNGEADEQIRSERIDGPHGNAVEAMFSSLVPGDEVVVFKLNEESSDARFPHGYRVAPYIKKLSNKTVN